MPLSLQCCVGNYKLLLLKGLVLLFHRQKKITPLRCKKLEIKRSLTWQFSQHSPCAHTEPSDSLQVSGSQQSFVHSCERTSGQSPGTVRRGWSPLTAFPAKHPALGNQGGGDVWDLLFSPLQSGPSGSWASVVSERVRSVRWVRLWKCKWESCEELLLFC